jgi:hypothetical protein
MWVKCTDTNGQPLWANLDNATTVIRREVPEPGTEIVFIGGGQVIVREKPEQLLARQ